MPIPSPTAVAEASRLLHDLHARCPRPQETHLGADHIAGVLADLDATVAIVDTVPEALGAFAAALEHAEPPAVPEDVAEALTAAWARVSSLPPLPDGEHPQLDVIRPTLEALRLALAALAEVPAAVAEFARLRGY